MTLQDLLKPQTKLDATPKSSLDAQNAQNAQRAKTAQLIAANKAVAAKILKDTLSRIESSKPVSRSVERKIWI